MLPQGQETRPAEPALPVPSCSDAHLGTARLAQLSLCPSHSLKPTESSFAAYFLMDIPTAPVRDSLLPRSPAPTPQPGSASQELWWVLSPVPHSAARTAQCPHHRHRPVTVPSHKLCTPQHPKPSVCCVHRAKADPDVQFPAPSPSVPLSFAPRSPAPRAPGSWVPSHGRASWGHRRSTSPTRCTHPQAQHGVQTYRKCREKLRSFPICPRCSGNKRRRFSSACS